MVEANAVEKNSGISVDSVQEFERREDRPAGLHRLLYVLAVICLGALMGGATAWLVAQMLT